MTQIYQGKHSTYYSQITLLVTGQQLFEPDWKTGLEPAIFDENKHAVAISTANNTDVSVTVCDDAADIPSGFQEATSGTLSVSDSGLEVGDFTTDNIAKIAYPAGDTSVVIYKNSANPPEATEIAVLLKK
jgi:hypothetical protein